MGNGSGVKDEELSEDGGVRIRLKEALLERELED